MDGVAERESKGEALRRAMRGHGRVSRGSVGRGGRTGPLRADGALRVPGISRVRPSRDTTFSVSEIGRAHV